MISDTERSKIFISVFQCLSIFVDFITLEINSNAIHMYSFDGINDDRAQVLFLDIIFDKSFFSDFFIENPISIVLKVELVDLCLKNKNSIDSIVVKYYDDIFELIFHRTGGYISTHKIPEMLCQSSGIPIDHSIFFLITN
ncbi:hypothetical protein PPL_08115 [Heterostelium album PN500]|uniref:Uncharacterized protein n=1 Tax=Heterostelium pallidum (strain ATCC 26659 / Pp 5 / PN500) TaxID=670386 RepID=D3BIN5_HETP5|nr:hypothetical protein PPL_08115 [Heterostelium album PN500]EFA78659.1 hypothetical protein PPL_08115 [Heterostelium album PN500]|eukprot:XP_020430783.1 hypothetical protein PPL_08115 [Heterostelium album PN500]